MTDKESAGNFVDPKLFAEGSLLAASVKVLRLNWRSSGLAFLFLFALVIVKEALQKNDIGGGFPDAFIWAMFSGPIIRTLLLGEIGSDKVDAKPGMWLRVYALGAIAYVPIFALTIFFAATNMLNVLSILGMACLLFLASILGVLVAATLGTWIVPVAIRSESAIGAAFKRGRLTLPYALPRLLGAPFILNLAMIAFTLSGALWLPTGDILSKQNYVNVVETVFFSAVLILQMFVTASALVVIVRAYVRASALSDGQSGPQ